MSRQQIFDELDYLRFYYRNVQGALGPADSDINREIGREYEESSGKLAPPAYRWWADEEEEPTPEPTDPTPEPEPVEPAPEDPAPSEQTG